MLRIGLGAFLMVFLAELGDKTQLAVFSLTTQSRSPWAVFVGAGAGLLLSTALTVGLAFLLRQGIPEAWTRGLHIAAGVVFILAGAWTIWRA